MAGEMGVLGYPQLIFKQTYEGTVTNKAEFLQLVKTAINDQVGGEMAGIHAVRSVVDTAIEKGHTNTVTPIVLSTSDERLAIQLAEALERLTPRVFAVTAGKSSKAMKAVASVSVKEATEESVEEALATIRSNLKK
jgi:hypothetical protein